MKLKQLQTKMWEKIRIIDCHTVKYFTKMLSMQDPQGETTTTTTTTTKTKTTTAKGKAAGSPKRNDYDYDYDFNVPPYMRRTNGASKHLGFSFLLDPLLNDVYHNTQGDSLRNNFFEGFQVDFSFFLPFFHFCVPQVLVHSPYEFAEVNKKHFIDMQMLQIYRGGKQFIDMIYANVTSGEW